MLHFARCINVHLESLNLPKLYSGKKKKKAELAVGLDHELRLLVVPHMAQLAPHFSHEIQQVAPRENHRLEDYLVLQGVGAESTAQTQVPVAPTSSRKRPHPSSSSTPAHEESSRDAPVAATTSLSASSIFVNNAQQLQQPHTSPASPDAGAFSTPHESMLFSQLVQMQFTEAEIRDIFTRLGPTALAGASVDSVMCELIAVREAEAEAAELDKARRLSEQDKEGEQKRRRDRREEELLQADCTEWRHVWFPESWILPMWSKEIVDRVIQQNSAVKKKVISLLQLEQKARQWYGSQLPKGYFTTAIGQPLSMCSIADWPNQLQAHVQTLQYHMFTLSEQKLGVPKLFAAATESPVEVIEILD